MSESELIRRIAHVIDFASFLAGANSDRDAAGRRRAMDKAREIYVLVEREWGERR
jgi:hypothetical protein